MTHRIAIAALTALLTATAPAAALDSAVCSGEQAPAKVPRFDDAAHGTWYDRFWTGDCHDLFWCRSGEPSWERTVARAIERHALATGGAVVARLCELGRQVGYEWARANDVRRIDTDDVSAWLRELEAAEDLLAMLAELERRAAARLGR